ncbi:uncharacterized protein G6M90_00g064520 [Metarhizium brunneum]|uniref:Heterokaryon incompatibility domain-containing protein n=1 Tax=Metarhizium brunneum TaxID=500148 RepID=A0A7D5YR82_9HYPO|nr:hypothetical protein G6M90_00g064520 [Metarhizium brunneum]
MPSPSDLLFKHDPLSTPSSIHLLERLNPSPDGNLCFSLVAKDLDDTTSPPHICLSYTWDTTPSITPPTRASWSNLPADLATEKGHDAVAAFIKAAQAGETEEEQGTASLAVASGRVPRPMVWADAICINQEDVVEKSTQAAMMDRVYSNAMYTLACLGPSDDHSSRGIQV